MHIISTSLDVAEIESVSKILSLSIIAFHRDKNTDEQTFSRAVHLQCLFCIRQKESSSVLSWSLFVF